MPTMLESARDRVALRRRVRIPCQVVEEDGFSLLASQCLDLSVRGMGVRARSPVPIGTDVLVSFRIPNSPLFCDVPARVSRIVWGRRREDHDFGLGLEFGELDATTRAVLAVRLRGIPPPAPARPLRVDYAESVRRIHENARGS
jgi:Tfp pilus assembly protein PilZ